MDNITLKHVYGTIALLLFHITWCWFDEKVSSF